MLLQQYMALYYYRKHYLEQDYKNDLGSQIMQFLVIKGVYPDVADGVKQKELEVGEVDPPTVQS